MRRQPYGGRRSPGSACRKTSPFRQAVSCAAGRGYQSAAQRMNVPAQRRQKAGFSLKSFLTDVAVGAVTNGLAGACFYGTGKAVSALTDGIRKSEGGLGAFETASKTNPFDLQPTHSQTLSKNKMNALMDDIKMNGIQEPIKYVEYNGRMYVVDGHHRLLAAKKLGLTEVPIEKVDLPYAGYNTIDDLLWFE